MTEPLSRTRHRLRVEELTWRNTPPYPPVTLYRTQCACGWLGLWHAYRENVERVCAFTLAREIA